MALTNKRRLYPCMCISIIGCIVTGILYRDGLIERMTIYYETDRNYLRLPPGLLRISQRIDTPKVLLNDSESTAEVVYEQFLNFDALSCVAVERMGKGGDGGWDYCMTGPFKPKNASCLVYSFGINNDWSFDDAISNEYGCNVVAFDPSMKKKEHARSKLVKFYPWGLGGKNEQIKKGWQMKTLGTIVKELGHENRTIDYLKVDIEYSEWDSFATALVENIIPRVKQIGFETHTMELTKGKKTTTADFSYYADVLRGIEELGFEKFSTHYNKFGIYTSSRTGIQRTCCKELVYLNMNFLRPGYEHSLQLS